MHQNCCDSNRAKHHDNGMVIIIYHYNLYCTIDSISFLTLIQKSVYYAQSKLAMWLACITDGQSSLCQLQLSLYDCLFACKLSTC